MNKIKIKNNTIKFIFNIKDYPLEAIYGTAYVFIDNAYLFLNSQAPKKIEVFLKGKKKLSKKQLNNLKDEFLNELLHNTLRMTITKRNKKIREFIVSRALFSIIENIETKDKNYPEDSLNITVPWSKKKNKKIKTQSKKVSSKKKK
ncbi:His-Xaa-Ser system protein HxsD [Patescibacteria group bacterium]|nr:His-Xaa-Ser system protein HxsD [Patescibacteria group bacterium]